MAKCFTSQARRCIGIPAIAIGMLLVCRSMPANGQSNSAGRSVDLIVDGRVERVFRDGNDHLIQILVQAAEAPQLNLAGGIRYPAPGQTIYVHVEADESALRRAARGPSPAAVPDRTSPIRARLIAGTDGRWVASGQDWFETSLGRGIGRAPLDETGAQGNGLGIEAELAFVDGQSALKVKGVTPQSPAALAGIEPGDVLMKAAGFSLESQAQLDEAFRNSRGTLEVIVRDIRSGRDVPVEIKSAGTSAATVSPTTRSLGILTETAFYGGEAVLKVTGVDPGSPAREAIEPGLLILKVDGRAVSKPDELKAAVQRSPGRIELEVVNPEDRRTRTVRIRL